MTQNEISAFIFCSIFFIAPALNFKFQPDDYEKYREHHSGRSSHPPRGDHSGFRLSVSFTVMKFTEENWKFAKDKGVSIYLFFGFLYAVISLLLTMLLIYLAPYESKTVIYKTLATILFPTAFFYHGYKVRNYKG